MVVHVKGTDNKFADAFSRLPLQNSETALPELSRDITLKRIAAEGITLSRLQAATKDDPVLKQVIPFVNGHWPHKSQVPTDLLPYYHVCGDLLVKDVCLAQEAQFIAPINQSVYSGM